MKKISLKDKIPSSYILFTVAQENYLCKTYNNVANENLTFHQLLRKVKIYPFSTKHKGVIHIIAEGGLDGTVYILNNYERGGLYEYGKTDGYA